MKRFMASLFVLLIFLTGISFLTNPDPRAPAASRDDCLIMSVSDNGWHTNLHIPANWFAADHRLRQDFPFATWFMIGWGDEGFYQDGPSVMGGLDAIIPPSPTVFHIIALEAHPSEFFIEPHIDVALSSMGRDVLIEGLSSSLSDAESLAEGHWRGRSRFYRSDLSYHAFHTCNQWTAGRLREAGLGINAPVSMLSGTLMWQLSRLPSACEVEAEVLNAQ